MKTLIEKRNYIIIFIIAFLLFFIFMGKNEVYVDTFKFDKNIITVMIYDRIDKNNVKKNIKDICRKDYRKNVKKIADNYDLYGGYISMKIKEYFKSKKIDKYIINENGDITTGKRYNDTAYKISINDSDNKVLKIVNLVNENISTIRDGEDSISVIGKDIVKNKIYKYMLNDVSTDEGKEIIKDKDIAVLWYRDGNITMSDNFEKYVK
ncbi:MAG: hypothetical protein IKF01_01330 [Bacilli bacterium]|nr:hypothetical protein [Bacilli bacterium]